MKMEDHHHHQGLGVPAGQEKGKGAAKKQEMCGKCDQRIDLRKTNSFISCQICERKFHDKCFGLTVKLVQELRSLNRLLCCEGCNNSCLNIIGRIAALETKMCLMESEVTKNSESIEEHGQKLRVLESRDGSACHVDQILDELKEREKRRHNIKIFNLPESADEGWEEIRNHDSALALNIIKKLGQGTGDVEIKDCFRLGKKDKNRPRPVIIKLADEDQKMKVLLKRRLLKESLGFGIVKIGEDLTREQRENLTTKYREVQSKNTTEGDHNFVWIVTQKGGTAKVRRVRKTKTTK